MNDIFEYTNMYSKIFSLHAELMKALAHPKRLEIVHLLRDQELSVGEIQSMLDLPQANLSQHLTILREARVVSTRRDGKQVNYSLAHKNIIKASDLMRELLIENSMGSELESEMKIKMTELVPLTRDPVCSMRVSPKTAGFDTMYGDVRYYFCASGCLDKFLKNKEKYAQ